MSALIRKITVCALAGAMALALGACNHRYSVSVNERVLYDPRADVTQVYFPDPGLQSCVNVRLRQQETSSLDDLTLLSCANLEIRSLEGITSLRNLEFIDLGGNMLTHLDELRRLNRLISVRAPDNPLTDISTLNAMRNVTSVVLTGSETIPCRQLDTLAARLGEDLVRPENCEP